MWRVCFLLTSATASLHAYATDNTASASLAGLAQTLVGLALVVAAIIACAWALRRVAAPGRGSAAWLRTVASTTVGPRERIVALEVGDTWLILGVTANQITHLHTLPRGELPDTPSVAPSFDFKTLLARTLGRTK
ncbi:MAG: flagellar biosynthetic protein FliO [Burkholderiales bacterium]